MKKLEFCQNTFEIDPHGILIWSKLNTAIVSDLHLEKGSSYAKYGQYIPPYDSLETLIKLEKILSNVTIEDRVYRLRCVEAWSMVIPWQGFQLSELIKMAEPLSSAKYVQFVTVFRPEEMPGQQKRTIIWPYREGLRMDEAMNPLTILATGLYGHEMPNQNGAPIRLVVPWKYGFKSIKSIVEIRFLDTQPETSWETLAPWEYGFYANVNPNVNHPRWSQGTERRIGEFKRRETLMFNGYEEEVAHLYKDLDLTKFY